ncbi:TnsA-like heteromeric transposase endonuclease subunit [Arthrobacter sp. ISL-65]|uniref:TnsA-like heteromeric transposase endonuclease subunit n=1 Tax=Arthrobacter sp. ISL-65 TaxID=2819112 RepID=UPI001BE8B95D|nr:TnsA-like heteromeric transposase endonuclease subunit [Arthrobacter sp. ISL-65]MBT2546763.1 TnsA-like heteromeric transposase endonuclease subunit [Arthrobacter sp. ISL-65]
MTAIKTGSRRPRLDKLPISLAVEALSWVDSGGKIRTAAADSRASALGLEKARAARESANYPGRPNHPGYYWCAGTGALVRYESWTEYLALMWLDHMYAIRAISSQPMCLHFLDGSHHFPDFFAVYESGSQLLIDVHPEEETTEDDMETFRKTEFLCDRIGWDYLLFTGLSKTLSNNLEWIAAYRHGRYLPPPEVTLNLQAFLQEPHSLRDTGLWVGSGDASAMIHSLYSLMWHRFVLFDQEQPLTWSTILHCEAPVEMSESEALE